MLLAKTAPQNLTVGFSDEALKALYNALARLGADSRSQAQTQTIGFESHIVPFSHRVLIRLRDMLLDAATQPGGEQASALVRRLTRIALAESLDSTASEAAQTLAETTIGDLVHDLRVSRAMSIPGVQLAL